MGLVECGVRLMGVRIERAAEFTEHNRELAN